MKMISEAIQLKIGKIVNLNLILIWEKTKKYTDTPI